MANELILVHRGYELRTRINPDAGVRIIRPRHGLMEFADSVEAGKAWIDNVLDTEEDF